MSSTTVISQLDLIADTTCRTCSPYLQGMCCVITSSRPADARHICVGSLYLHGMYLVITSARHVVARQICLCGMCRVVTSTRHVLTHRVYTGCVGSSHLQDKCWLTSSVRVALAHYVCKTWVDLSRVHATRHVLSLRVYTGCTCVSHLHGMCLLMSSARHASARHSCAGYTCI